MKRALVVLFALMLLSCGSTRKPDLDYRSGTEGVTMKFSAERPSSILYTGDKANIMVEIWNRGAENMDFGSVYLSGFDPKVIHISGYDTNIMTVYENIPATQGKGPWDEVGGYNEVVFFEDEGVSVPYGDTYKTEIMATSCYMYSTLATPEVCVLSKPEQLRTEKVCWPGKIELTNQGGPVAVTKIEEYILDNKLAFTIYVKNVGDGKVINPESFSRCPFGLEPYDKDVVVVELSMSGSGKITCKPEDQKIRLSNKEGLIFCEVPIELETFWTTPLNIRLKYGYSSSIKKPIEIKNVPGKSTYVGEKRTVTP